MRKKDKRKIYKTIDGYFNSRPDIKKPRKVAIIYQRDDKAVALVKIYSKKEKKAKAFIPKLVLKSKKYKSLSEDSIVGNSLIYGRKFNNKIYPIYPTDLVETKDKLKYKDFIKIKKESECGYKTT